VRFARLHPAVPFAYYAGLIALIFAVGHPVFKITIAAGVAALAFFFAGARKAARSLAVLIPVGLVFGLINPLFVRRGATILFYFFGNPVTLEAAAFGFVNLLTLVSVVTLFISFNKIVDQPAFLYLTARYLPCTASVINLSVQSASRFGQRASAFAEVQRTKGVRIDAGGARERSASAARLLGAFTARSLEEGMETAVVFKAKDYGTAKRTNYRSYVFRRRDAAFLVLQASIWVSVFVLTLRGAASYEFYPRLQPFALSETGLLMFSLFLLYIILPFIYELRLKWK